jgi:HEAT repeat protein
MRSIAMGALGDFRDEGSVDDLVSFLRSSDINDRQAASFAPYHIGGIQVIDQLMALLSDPNLEARRSAIQSLGLLRSTQGSLCVSTHSL